MSESHQAVKSFFIFSILSALFALSMFFRVSNAVIAPNLVRDLSLDAEALGILGGAYFYSFALLQIPMGPMLDRIGPRMVVTVFPLIGGLGSFLFAFGGSFPSVFIGRILIGVGMASVMMSTMKIFIERFPSEKFSTLLGITISIGTLGSFLAASPLAYFALTIGWRTTFILAGGVVVLLAFSIFGVLGGEKKKEERHIFKSSSKPAIGIIQSIRLLLGSLAFWQVGAVAFFRYGTFIGLQGLWLGPYLIDVKGYSPVQAGYSLTFLAIGAIVGSPVAGRLSDRTFYSIKGVTLWGLSLYSLSLLSLIAIIRLKSPFLDGLVFFLIGFFCSFGMLLYSHAKELFPVAISGTVLTGVNFFTMAGGAFFMPVLGKVIESFPRTNHAYPPQAYRLSFLICFLGMIGSLVFYAFSKKEKRR